MHRCVVYDCLAEGDDECIVEALVPAYGSFELVERRYEVCREHYNMYFGITESTPIKE